jgi:hypothetical protein
MAKTTFALSFALGLYLSDYQHWFESRSGNESLSANAERLFALVAVKAISPLTGFPYGGISPSLFFDLDQVRQLTTELA